MARGLLAEGRAADVARMLEPLLEGLPAPGTPVEPGQVLLRALLARVRLLHRGDARGVLEGLAPFRASDARAALPAGVRAEVTLWLGWAHGWADETTYDHAQALHLLDEAERLFRAELNAGGRCWTLLGQAQAYLSMDERGLTRQALQAAAALQEKLQDVQAARWIHDLSAASALEAGRCAEAQHHLDALAEQGRAGRDPLAQGTAHAYRAALLLDLGRTPEAVLEGAQEAEALLSRAAVQPGRPLLYAARARLRALLRSGRWDEAAAALDSYRSSLRGIPTAPISLQMIRAHLALLRGNDQETQEQLDGVWSALRPHQHRLLASRIALLQGRLLSRQGEAVRAKEWTERACLSARETGYARQELQALLTLAEVELDAGDLDAARRHLREAEGYGDLFSLLPVAALRFRILGRLAEAEDNPEDARAFLAQALSGYSLIGDAYHTAAVQLALARLGRTAEPAAARPLLEAAVLTFSGLQAAPELEGAKALLQAWPPEQEAAPSDQQPPFGTLLARAALSVELLAAAWLQIMERLLPAAWMGVYRCDEDGVWQCVHEQGTPPAPLPFPGTDEPEVYGEGIVWLRLRPHPGPAFFAGITLPASGDPAWEVARARLTPWLPVAALALDHALLRTQRLEPFRQAAPEENVQIPLDHFIYASPAMRELAAQIHRIRASHSAVLVTGESGTGKELVARAVHATSERKKAPFVAFNCSTVPHELFDSHLFGHEKGAFTGAASAQPGVIRAADGGTLFLDEIGDLPLDVQPKLLRFLQEGEVFPLGARRPLGVDVRVVAATNRDLEVLVREGRFREDLYYRLNVIPLRVPPLHERREDIPLLVRHFLDQLRPPGAPLATITPPALEALLRYRWPGNVRQLRNEIERALVFVSSEPAPTIDLKNLSSAVREAAEVPASTGPRPPEDQILEPGFDLETALARTERTLIERVLAACDGQVSAAAEVLGLTRQGLYKKMKRLGVDGARFQERSTERSPSPSLHLN